MSTGILNETTTVIGGKSVVVAGRNTPVGTYNLNFKVEQTDSGLSLFSLTVPVTVTDFQLAVPPMSFASFSDGKIRGRVNIDVQTSHRVHLTFSYIVTPSGDDIDAMLSGFTVGSDTIQSRRFESDTLFLLNYSIDVPSGASGTYDVHIIVIGEGVRKESIETVSIP